MEFCALYNVSMILVAKGSALLACKQSSLCAKWLRAGRAPRAAFIHDSPCMGFCDCKTVNPSFLVYQDDTESMKRSLPTVPPPPPLPLADRVILVTGAGGGIGQAACRLFAARGAKVVCADISEEAANATAKLAREDGAAEAVCADVSSEAGCQQMVVAAVAKFGRLDCALNAAGIEGDRARLHETSIENFDKVMDANLRGTFLSMKAELEQMLRQPAPAGAATFRAVESVAESVAAASAAAAAAAIDVHNYCIVNVSSTAGQGAMPEFSCYSASKFAILGLTRSAAREYASAGIRVNAVCPSTTDTPMVARFTERWPEWQAKQNVRARNHVQITWAAPQPQCALHLAVVALVALTLCGRSRASFPAGLISRRPDRPRRGGGSGVRLPLLGRLPHDDRGEPHHRRWDRGVRQNVTRFTSCGRKHGPNPHAGRRTARTGVRGARDAARQSDFRFGL
jgi:NAD(P)-dependent dehydrogenase (short-subunit alcohol dehydrogenase family)